MPSEVPWWKPGLAGGLGAMGATVVTSPVDIIKVRRQMFGELEGKNAVSTLATARDIYKTGGVAGFYSGLPAGILRQSVYSTSRFSLFEIFKGYYPNATLLEKLPMAMAAGGLGSLLSSPTDLVMLRMQADGRLPPEAQRNYRSPIHALVQIVEKGGVFALWNGCGPNINRAMLVTASQMIPYEFAKNSLLEQTFIPVSNGLGLHTMASLFSGFVTVVVCCPADVVRARIMNAGVMERLKYYAVDSVDCYGFTPKVAKYNGTIDCVRQIVRAEGPSGLYKGFWSYYARVGPYVVTLFVFKEQIQKVFTPSPNR